jgi:hypothetical protein
MPRAAQGEGIVSASPGTPFRLLLTGSRDWDNRPRLAHEMAATAGDLAYLSPVVLVHGACLTGADAIAAQEAAALGWAVEPHRANWARFGRAAGPRRNAEMVALGADICLCFAMPCSNPRCTVAEPHDSHGATDCADRAEAAGISVLRFRPGRRTER